VHHNQLWHYHFRSDGWG